MKIDRRSFLSFAVGGAAGTALSPLPWKLTDDSSIWSQMWPWTPVPPDGETTAVDTVCTLCPAGCGLSVRKVDDRAVKIEGLAGAPGNDGGICGLGLAGLQLVYGPTRIRNPLKQVGERGSGRWASVSWEEAIGELAAKLNALRSAGKAHNVGCLANSDRGTIPNLLARFLTVYGSPNFVRMPSMQDSYELTLHLMQGVQGTPGFDLFNADFVLSFGSGLLEGWGAPVRTIRAHGLWREKGAKVIQVEPRLSNTAAKADRWLAVKPGTESDLALGIAHVMIKENLYHTEFVENYSSGFDTWKATVMNDYTPEKVAQVTELKPPDVVNLALAFGGAKHPLALCGRGEGRTPGSLREFMAVHALNALAGNLNRKGGVVAVPEPEYIDWPEPEMDAVASASMQMERVDGAGSEQFPFSRYLANRLAANLSAGAGEGLEALFVYGANPLHTLPGTAEVKKALDTIPLLVSFATHMDETAAYADLILPNHAHLERWEDVPSPAGLPMPVIGLAQPVIEPPKGTRHTGDVVLQLAAEMGGTIATAFPWESYEACLEETLGDALEVLREETFLVDEGFTPAEWSQAFTTSTEKFEFAGGIIDKVPFKPADIEGDGPLTLVAYDSLRLAAGATGSPPFLIKIVEDTVLKGNEGFVEINPQTAAALGLREGSPARLVTSRGEARVRVHLFEGLMPNLVAMPRGLGHSAYDSFLAGKGTNVNDLIGPVEDPASGHDTAWGIRAKLVKA